MVQHQECATETLLETQSPAHRPAPTVAKFHFGSFDQFAEAMAGWDFDWRQLDRGALEASLLGVATPDASVRGFAFNRRFFQRGSSPPGMLTFGLIGGSVGNLDWCRGLVPSDDLLVFSTGGEYESVSQPRFNGHTLSFSDEHLDRIAADLELSVNFDAYRRGGFALQIGAAAATNLRHHLNRLERVVGDGPDDHSAERLRRGLESEIPERLVRLLADDPTTTSFRIDGFRVKAVQKARDYIEAHAELVPSMHDLCRVAGVSRRTLNYAFRELIGVPPKQYHQATRLDGVRKELHRMGPSATIADIANTWGFWHLGQFAADYRRQFGELPSDTLRRSGTA